MGEAKRRRDNNPAILWPSGAPSFVNGRFSEVAGFKIPPERRQAVADLYNHDLQFARQTGIAGNPHNETRELAAFHEAGHSVISSVHGLPPTRIRIFAIRNTKTWAGITDAVYQKSGFHAPLAANWRVAAILIAGFLAERCIEGAPNDSAFDEQFAFRFLIAHISSRLNLDEELVHAAGGRMVCSLLTEHQEALCAIAHALMTDTELNRKRLDQLLAGVHDAKRDRAEEFIAQLKREGSGR